ncbi:hypothetical protein [uncultured Clostridium sp.]|uniref:hypothetical protein n=1 Tax=uncultured Clostridium sp. TaxID=59620 RepID=UPI0025F5C0F2|nr:hypothetical protein [uncultured Clostridium sp.]
MINILNQLTISDEIQVLAIIVSAIVSIISIIIAVITLRQTNKINKEANRPYIVIYITCTQSLSIQNNYLVIKNFGKTSATIRNIKCSRNVDFCCGKDPFKNIINSTLAPGQSLCTVCSFKENKSEFMYSVEYMNSKDIYYDEFIINPEYSKNLIYVENTSSNLGELEKVILNSTEQIIKSTF